MGQLTDYREQLDSLNTQLGEVQNKITELNTALAGYEQRKSEIQFEIQTLKIKIVKAFQDGE